MPSLIDTVSRPAAWTAIRRTLVQLRDDAQNLSSLSAAGDTGRSSYRALQNSCDNAIDVLTTNAATPNLAAYVIQEVDSTYAGNLATDFAATVQAIQDLQNWIDANYPKSAGGADETYTTNANGVTTELTFGTAQTADFRTAVTDFLAAPFLAEL